MAEMPRLPTHGAARHYERNSATRPGAAGDVNANHNHYSNYPNYSNPNPNSNPKLPLRKRHVDAMAPTITQDVERRLIRIEQARRSSLAAASSMGMAPPRAFESQQYLFAGSSGSRADNMMAAHQAAQSRVLDSQHFDQFLLRNGGASGHSYHNAPPPPPQALPSSVAATHHLTSLLAQAGAAEARAQKSHLMRSLLGNAAYEQQQHQQQIIRQDILLAARQEQEQQQQQQQQQRILIQEEILQRAFYEGNISSHTSSRMNTTLNQDKILNNQPGSQRISQLMAADLANKGINNGTPTSSSKDKHHSARSSTTESVAAGQKLTSHEHEQADQANTNAITATQKERASNENNQDHHPSTTNSSTNNIRISLPSDAKFLTEAHCFLRSLCLESFISTPEQVCAPGKGARPMRPGQVGFRCIHCTDVPRSEQANQAVCYPSKRDNIFESIRNFQRVHVLSCSCMPEGVKEQYREIIERGNGPKRSQKLVRAYYAQAAAEVGLVDTPRGLDYVEENNCTKSGPSKEMLSIMEAAEAEEISLGGGGGGGAASYSLENVACSSETNNPAVCTGVNLDIKYGKFSSIVTSKTRQILDVAQNKTTPFVLPEDFVTISDYVYLIFHQLLPCKPTESTIKRRRLNPEELKDIPGLCCKHCHDKQTNGSGNVVTNNGMYFPRNITSLGDSSFSQTLHVHLTNCACVPPEVKSALVELKDLAKTHNVCVKRGSKRVFIDKIWRRMEDWSKQDSSSEQ